MSNKRSNVVTTKSVPPKTTKMNNRVSKSVCKSGRGEMVYPSGCTGTSGNGLRK